MVKIIWTDNAIQDLHEIGEYIAKDSIHYARKTVEDLFYSADILESHPKAGKILEELGLEEIRQLIIGNFRIIYEIIDHQRIDILTVHRTSRLLDNVLDLEDI